MNRDWAEKNKKMQSLIGKKDGFREGIEVLIGLRNDLFGQITQIVGTYPPEAFFQMPFARAEGYHSKTLVYSMWHVFRIEDIVAHTLIAQDSQVLFADRWLGKTKSPLITTGNELRGTEIAAFSKQLDVKAVHAYGRAVMESTNGLLRSLEYGDLKRKFTDADRERMIAGRCVSTDENAVWLIDYWCGKDVRGLIRMPFSRHWIMHIEAMCRIKNELCRQARKGVDPIACCGLSCDRCIYREWCGSCRTRYNACSFAACAPDGKCPNASCCGERGLDGCFECDQLDVCRNGFYANGLDGNAAKAMALFIRKHGRKGLPAALEKLERQYGDQKLQEVIGGSAEEGLRILEANE